MKESDHFVSAIISSSILKELMGKPILQNFSREKEMAKQKDHLSRELISLFDLRKSKMRDDKELTQAANEAQRDIRYLTLMFSDGIPSLDMPVSDSEIIRWDARAEKLIYINGETMQLLEASSKEIRVKMRPFLADLVKKAREFYSDR